MARLEGSSRRLIELNDGGLSRFYQTALIAARPPTQTPRSGRRSPMTVLLFNGRVGFGFAEGASGWSLVSSDVATQIVSRCPALRLPWCLFGGHVREDGAGYLSRGAVVASAQQRLPQSVDTFQVDFRKVERLRCQRLHLDSSHRRWMTLAAGPTAFKKWSNVAVEIAFYG